MDGGINGSQRMSGIGLRWEQGSDIGFWICISYRVLGLHLLNTFSLPVDGPRGTRGRARKEMMGQNCRRFLRPSKKRWWFHLYGGFFHPFSFFSSSPRYCRLLFFRRQTRLTMT
ncbi:unnamed protein product [Musa acuminata var. zebrina]